MLESGSTPSSKKDKMTKGKQSEPLISIDEKELIEKGALTPTY